jgi:4-amino-4-deoxy-L-arabinose transferase-like glycosyltransferase
MFPQNGQNPLGQAPNAQGGGTPFSQETGNPGVFRFFTAPLSKQMSWLLPFALISVLLALFSSKIKLPIESGVHKALLLWGGWLLTCVVFFSMVSGIFHAYYAIMLAPALGAMVGIGFSQLWSWSRDKNWAGVLLIGASAITIAFQIFAMVQYGEASWWLLGVGIFFLAGSISIVMMKRVAYVTLLVSMLIIPMYWTVMTSVASSDINLPTAYTGTSQQGGPNDGNRARGQGNPGSSVNEEMLAYLEANTQDVKYLVAVPSSQQGSQLVLETGRPVLFMGGFGGQDEVVTAGDLNAMVTNGELRYVLYGGDRGSKQDITNWLTSSCSVMLDYSQVSTNTPAPQTINGQALDGGNPGNQTITLYSCK